MKKFEYTADDIRAGDRHMMRKMAEHLSEMGGESKKSETKKDFSEVKEFDLESKITVKDVAEAFNNLLAVLKK